MGIGTDRMWAIYALVAGAGILLLIAAFLAIQERRKTGSNAGLFALLAVPVLFAYIVLLSASENHIAKLIIALIVPGLCLGCILAEAWRLISRMMGAQGPMAYLAHLGRLVGLLFCGYGLYAFFVDPWMDGQHRLLWLVVAVEAWMVAPFIVRSGFAR